MNNERRKRVVVVRDEGRAAFAAGKHMQSCPYKTGYPDWGQWQRGYDEAAREAEHNQQEQA